MLILAINPGSTSMKIAIFEDEQEQMRTVIRFDTQVLNSFQTQEEQNEYRPERGFRISAGKRIQR